MGDQGLGIRDQELGGRDYPGRDIPQSVVSLALKLLSRP